MTIREIHQKLESGVKSRVWSRYLQEDDRFQDLYIIIKAKGDKREIFKELFKGADFNTEESKQTWNRLASLETDGLIFIEKAGKKIVRFHYHPSLPAELPIQVLDVSPRRPLVHKFFPIPKNLDRKDENDPFYEGVIRMEEPVIIPSGVAHHYRVYVKDGRLMVTIAPVNEQEF